MNRRHEILLGNGTLRRISGQTDSESIFVDAARQVDPKAFVDLESAKAIIHPVIGSIRVNEEGNVNYTQQEIVVPARKRQA